MSRHHVKLNAGRWARVRRRVLDAGRWRCAECGRYGNEVDHVKPLHRGGDAWDAANLQVLCKRHHIEKTRSENRREPTPAEARWRELVQELAGRSGTGLSSAQQQTREGVDLV